MKRYHGWLGTAALAFLVAVASLAQPPPPQDRYRLSLRTRVFVPNLGVELDLSNLDETATFVHVHLQFFEPPARAFRQTLLDAGIRVQKFTQGTTYFAALSRTVAENLAANGLTVLAPDIAQSIRWIGTITADEKVQPALLQQRFPPHVRNSDGTLRVLVSFHDDVDEQAARRVLDAYAEQIRPFSTNDWDIDLPRTELLNIAAEDLVKGVEGMTVPFIPLNDAARGVLNVDSIQAIDLTTDPPTYDGPVGADARVAIMDSPVDIEHDDFWEHDSAGHRTTLRLEHIPGGSDDHGTHVAGTIAGNGYQSKAAGGGERQWRGIAPFATLLSLDVKQANAGEPEPYYDAFVELGADLSNNSFVQNCGTYDKAAQLVDQIIRGDYAHQGTTLPARTQIWAAGNNGMFVNDCWWEPYIGYFSIFASAKNSIAVGAVNVNDTSHYKESSLGPTLDGRIKPDLAAPGSSSLSGNVGINSTNADSNDYRVDSGSSFAAAAATGSATLLIEEWRKYFTGSTNCDEQLAGCLPLPSTIKATFIQGATDLVSDVIDPEPNPDTDHPVQYFAGPDYATGYGLIDVERAIDIVRAGPGVSRRIVESSIDDLAEQDEYLIEVPANTAKLRVTLAWDDEAAESSIAPYTASRLVNDLDLVLIDPLENLWLPWIFDPALQSSATPSGKDPVPHIHQATTGPDHANNVEQVEVVAPAEGEWKIRVTGYALPNENPQGYSLATDYPIFATWALPVPSLPPEIQPCLDLVWAPVIGGIRIQYPELARCGSVGTGPVCNYILGCPTCDAIGICSPLRINFRDVPADFRIAIYDQFGNRLAADEALDGGDPRSKSIFLERELGADYRFIFFAQPDTRPQGTYTLRLSLGNTDP